MRTTLAGVAASLLSLSAPAAVAQDYPARPVTIVVPFAAGGGSDAIARVLADELSKRMDARFLIDNQGGAGTNLGNGIAAQAEPDGYTLLLGQVTLGINPALYTNLAYRVQDFVPIAFVASSPTVMVVNNDSPAKSVDDFIKLAKAEPDAFNFASGGSGTSVHLAGELFQTKTGTQMVHVPYRGSGPAVADLIGGQVQVMFDTAASATSQVKGGSLRALAVTGEARFPELPDVPTFQEAGLPDFDVSAWYGLMGPKGTPDAVVTKLNGEINALLADPAVQTRFLAMGAQTSTKTPAEFRTFVDEEIERWGTVVRDSRIELE